jgi:hypothetical protein
VDDVSPWTVQRAVPSLTLSCAGPEHAAQVVELVNEGLEGYRAWAPAGWRLAVPSKDEVLRIAERLELPEVWCQLGHIKGQLVGIVSLAPRTRADPDPPAPGTLKRSSSSVRRGRGVGSPPLCSTVPSPRPSVAAFTG